MSSSKKRFGATQTQWLASMAGDPQMQAFQVARMRPSGILVAASGVST